MELIERHMVSNLRSILYRNSSFNHSTGFPSYRRDNTEVMLLNEKKVNSPSSNLEN